MVTPKQLIPPTQLTTGAFVYYAVPALTTCIVKKMTFCNTSGGPVSVTIYFGANDDAHSVYKVKILAALETWEAFATENHVLPAASQIQLVASANTAVTVIASGLEVT